jgi:hypothetical protein
VSVPTIILRLDLTGTAFGTAPTWTDYTSHLLTAGDGQPILINWGRQDNESEVQPSTCSFVLDNTNGQWTPGNAAADPDWDVGAPVNIRVTHNAVTYDRFTGYVDSIEPAYPGQSWSRVLVTCSDVMARLGRANGLRSLLQYEMLADSPSYLYPLTETNPSSSSADIISTSNPLAVRVDGPFGGTKADFGATLPGLFDDATGVEFGPNASTVDTPVTVLSIAYNTTSGPFVPLTGAHTQECWIITPTAIPATSAELLYQAVAPATSPPWAILFITTSGLLRYQVIDASSGVNVLSPSSVCDGALHHVVVTLASDGKTLRLYLDGTQVSTNVAATALDLTGLRYNQIGGAVGVPDGSSTAQAFGQFPGTVTHVAMYGYELSADRVLAHYRAGVGTGPSERTDQRFGRIAGYGGITTSGLPTGFGTMVGQKTSGLPAIDSLKLVGRSEGAPVFAAKTGAITMQSRQVRYAAAMAATITAADIDPDMTTRRDRQGLANEVTITNQGKASQVVIDTTSKNKHGRFDAGSFDVSLASDDEALNLGQWQIATRKNPLTRLPDLTVDLLTGQTVALVAAVLGLDISSKIQVAGLPSQAPASSFTGFIEGASETIGVQDWSMSFFTSPVTLEDSVLVLDSSTQGLLDTNLLAF